mmetsp:Transcript_23209/g.65744  ORF Transcript_23209/g.65744 Transcript_23209/m.65744 type:complete len:305 (+) Transcript_23209:308-1222(+)
MTAATPTGNDGHIQSASSPHSSLSSLSSRSSSSKKTEQQKTNDDGITTKEHAIHPSSSSSSSCNDDDEYVIELECDIIEQVYKSWIEVTTIPDYAFVVGELLFRKIFELAPGAFSLFSFGITVDGNGDIPETLYTSPIFRKHSTVVVKCFGSVIQAMQQRCERAELRELATTMYDLGARHVSYGVHPAHYSVVGAAVLHALEKGFEALSSTPSPSSSQSTTTQWTTELRQGWKATYDFIATAMMSGAGHSLELSKVQRRDAERQKSATMRLHILRSSQGTSQLARGKELRRRGREKPPTARSKQ